MERYSKEYSSKWQSKYSEEFKRFVCNDYLTRREVEVKYNIGNSRLTYWLREKGYDYVKSRIVPLPSMKPPLNNSSEKDSRESVSELKKELQEAQLLAEAYRKMIEIAEREFKINIVKKSNTK